MAAGEGEQKREAHEVNEWLAAARRRSLAFGALARAGQWDDVYRDTLEFDKRSYGISRGQEEAPEEHAS